RAQHNNTSGLGFNKLSADPTPASLHRCAARLPGGSVVHPLRRCPACSLDDDRGGTQGRRRGGRTRSGATSPATISPISATVGASGSGGVATAANTTSTAVAEKRATARSR